MKKTAIFLGTPDFAVPSLQALIDDELTDVILVITQPDRPVGRKKILTAPPVKVLAQQHGIEVWQPEKVSKELEKLQSYPQPDYLIVVAYGQILSRKVLALPKIAPLNVHGSLLPHLRGAAPIHYAIWQGAKETGVSVQKMAYELDAGDVLHSISMPIEDRETTETLYSKMKDVGAKALIETLNMIDEKGMEALQQPQDETKVTMCCMLKKSDGQLDYTQLTAVELDRAVRALTPWPGVWIELNGQPLKLVQSSLEPAVNAMELRCKDDEVLYLLKTQKPGKQVITYGSR